MVIIMKADASQEDINEIVKAIKKYGLKPHISKGKEQSVIGVIGDRRSIGDISFDHLAGVEKVVPIMKPYKLVGREIKKHNTEIDINGAVIGGNEIAVIAGPCAIENKEMLMEAAHALSSIGVKFLRGGAFKPRTSPYSFQGLGLKGLEYLREAGNQYGMRVVTEVLDPRDAEVAAEYADILQIGTRNMQNFRLLEEAGRMNKPILLKRGMSATIKEFLMSAEYIMAQGNEKIILCERGIRTFETESRNSLDITSIPLLKLFTHLPVIVDPSHAAGRTDIISPISMAAVAAGADGLMLEVHPHPEDALCDGPQSLRPKVMTGLLKEIGLIANAINRTL